MPWEVGLLCATVLSKSKTRQKSEMPKSLRKLPNGYHVIITDVYSGQIDIGVDACDTCNCGRFFDEWIPDLKVSGIFHLAGKRPRGGVKLPGCWGLTSLGLSARQGI
jgi:hypothetical protein